MSIKHSIASKKRMASIPKDVLSKRMSENSKKRWSKLDAKARRKIGLDLVKARLSK